MDNQQQINDALRQSAHAAAREDAAMEAKMFAAAERAVQKAFQGFTIQSGNRIRCSGTGRNITVAYEDAPGAAGGLADKSNVPGVTADITVCVDDGMGGFTEQTASFVNGVLVSLA